MLDFLSIPFMECAVVLNHAPCFPKVKEFAVAVEQVTDMYPS